MTLTASDLTLRDGRVVHLRAVTRLPTRRRSCRPSSA